MFQGRQVLLRVSLLDVVGLFTLLALSPTPVGLANDKLDHFAAFLVLGLLSRLTFPAQGAVLTGLCLSLFGAGLEALQGLPFIQRDSDIGDWAADLAGIALAILITWTFSRSRRRPAPQ